MTEFDEVYDDFEKLMKKEEPETFGDILVKKTEEEFMGLNKEDQDRKNEVLKINEEMKNLNKQLLKCKNVKNYRMIKVNEERAKQRKNIKKKIEICKLRLEEIKLETQGK